MLCYDWKMRKEKPVVTRYHIENISLLNLQIALLTDLHDRPCEGLLELLEQENPDLILIAGDLGERHEPGMSEWTVEKMDKHQGISRMSRCFSRLIKVLDCLSNPRNRKMQWDEAVSRKFLEDASRIAPVFYSLGNHEWYVTDEDQDVMQRCGVTLLDNRDIEYRLSDGQMLRIGGLSTAFDLEWLTTYSQKTGPKILLCHHPEYYPRYIRNTQQDTFALIVSGHAHGGQWKIFGHPFLAPGQGFFPRYAYGIYDNKLVVSSGLSNTANIPRFGNPVELVMISLGLNTNAGKTPEIN